MFRNIVDDIFSGVGFEDLNIVNGTTEEVSGSFVVARLDGEQMFEKQFG
jgi:SOS-response transcriptional repressor LexA